VKALTTYLREKLARPDRVEMFYREFQARLKARSKGSTDAVSELDRQIKVQTARVSAVTENLINLPGSKALTKSLADEETKLAELEGQRDEARATRPRVLPHPASVAKDVRDLADLVEAGEAEKVGPILRRVLTPFQMVPAGASYILRGALDLSGPLRVCDQGSSGGVI
jgi:hypothetical protein